MPPQSKQGGNQWVSKLAQHALLGEVRNVAPLAWLSVGSSPNDALSSDGGDDLHVPAFGGWETGLAVRNS